MAFSNSSSLIEPSLSSIIISEEFLSLYILSCGLITWVFIKVLYLFFIMCSLLQLFINLDILAHFYPFSLINASRRLSSSSVHPYFFIFGERWLFHLYRHLEGCIKSEPWLEKYISILMLFQSSSPFSSIILNNCLSSSLLQ